jgi:hypothetical protein
MQPFALIESALGASRSWSAKPSNASRWELVRALAPASAWRSRWRRAGNWPPAIKLVGLSSVAVIAAQAVAAGVRGKFGVVIDAQRGEFYLAAYEASNEDALEIAPLRLATLGEVEERAQAGELLIGPEVTKWFPSGRIFFPGAATLSRLAQQRTDFVSGEKLEPIYLRETTFVKAPPARPLPFN